MKTLNDRLTIGLGIIDFSYVYNSFIKNNTWHCGADQYKVWIKTSSDTMEILFHKGIGHNGKLPTLSEVIECLSIDYIDSDMRDDFETWVSEFFGMAELLDDEDLYKQQKEIFDSCVKQSKQIDSLCFGNNWRQFVYKNINEIGE